MAWAYIYICKHFDFNKIQLTHGISEGYLDMKMKTRSMNNCYAYGIVFYELV